MKKLKLHFYSKALFRDLRVITQDSLERDRPYWWWDRVTFDLTLIVTPLIKEDKKPSITIGKYAVDLFKMSVTSCDIIASESSKDFRDVFYVNYDKLENEVTVGLATGWCHDDFHYDLPEWIDE